ncbi:type II secretion system secretin GspD [Pendulispora rubella]|uniref:Type II secretion system secretin GspD n=1 Tax=Pendulispora rubella TaxID=2741070 RepID=A0ABZ2LCC6_9BACT
MRKRLSLLAAVSLGTLVSGAVRDVRGQTPPTPPNRAQPPAATAATPPAAPATPAAPGAGRPALPTPPAAGAKGKPTESPAGKAQGDTDKLPQFDSAMEFEPRSPNYRVAFSLEDADLPELVRVIGQLTGKRFIFGGKVRNIKASVYSPQKVTVAEAYQAFLSILETNGLTVIPHGRFLKIVETAGIASQSTPTVGPQQGAPVEDRYVTRMHRLRNVNADEVANLLGKFKSKDADVSSYSAGNMLILTDTGTNIRRMMSIVEEIDVGGAGDQIWMETINYASAADIAQRVNELFDIKSGSSSSPPPSGPRGGPPAAAASSGGSGAGGGDLHISKILPDERTNKIIIVATEKAYLRILEIIKKMDVPQTTEGEIHVLPLQHADAVELTKTLNEIITGTGGSSGGGGGGQGGRGQQQGGGGGGGGAQQQGIFEGGVKVSADKATNSIVVTSSMRDYASLRAVVDRLDLPRRSVFIEAVILDLSITRSNQLGFNFHGGDTFGENSDGLIYGGLNPIKSIGLPTASPELLQGLALGVRGPAIPGSENLLGTGITIPSFGLVVQALATSTDTDVLSTPHILATDNQKAIINIGENIPLQQNLSLPSFPGVGTGAQSQAGALGALGGLGGFGGFGGTGARQDVGTKLTITPHLNDSNEVRLELNEEISEAKSAVGTAGVVPITKRNAETMLVVQDQQTVVIGGLMRNRLTHSEEKIPVLGDIPVLGALFRSTKNGMEKTNLILIMTPYIIREQADLRTIYERKMEERQQFLDRYFVFSDDSDYQPPKDYSRTNGLVEFIRQSYRGVEERKKLDDLLKPKELITHEPSEPLEMPAAPRSPSVNPGAPAHPTPAPTITPGPVRGAPPPTPSPGVTVTPPTRQINQVER